MTMEASEVREPRVRPVAPVAPVGGAEGATARLRAPAATELVGEHGRTTIADAVVAKIAGLAAREIPGVHELLPQGVGGTVAGLAQRVTGADPRAVGVNVEVGEREAAVDLRMTVGYGVSIPQVADAVRRNVMGRIQATTGLVVTEVNIDVSDLYFPEEDAVGAPLPAARRVE